jgi:hypothetical protein
MLNDIIKLTWDFCLKLYVASTIIKAPKGAFIVNKE